MRLFPYKGFVVKENGKRGLVKMTALPSALHFKSVTSYHFGSLIKRLTNMNGEHLPEDKEAQVSLLEP